ncbi:hypothetical protein OHB01_03370 [Microbispora hainanensis]|uniref:Uncharacterized protein n=1 Tax=Microbispora hainanensis TaxID=568844 RepID=A0A544YVT4_9ACTN|nr:MULTISPECIES: hypothetical protein [Microbispora]HEU4568376.1 hypothetical protein [Marmoricola sp.]MBE3007605.1 hypothetical protein [Microbispora sitophila]NJP24079.1 hypothetical protein [Microbispora sp. CL1-1]OPG03033.1 hypothetical protein B1L11_41135 [Microbispora sp. GKU 823]TQS15580.1 hypothetical protein FLW53_07675 [Microbispora sp. SCL1-1]
MSPFWKIFVAIFCYISGIVGLGLAVANASVKPPATTHAFVYGGLGVVFLIAGIVLSRRPRY